MLVSPTPFPWIANGADLWNSSCAVTQVPHIYTGSSPQAGHFNVDVIFQNGRNLDRGPTGGCGYTIREYNQSGDLTGVTIRIFEQSYSGEPCDNLDRTMAHEIGHLMGLGDVERWECRDRIMYGYNRPGPTTVSVEDCQRADAQWWTDFESPDPCDHPYPPQGCDPGGPDSPILLDLDRNGFLLTGLGDPVSFDIDADGVAETLSWTDPRGLDAFLALDRNGDGAITSGAELFGNHTPRVDGSTAENGYIPLAEFDLPALGGNGNGAIDAGDVVYDELLLWIDQNHDAISQPGETLSLAQAGVVRIGLDFRYTKRRDKAGNFFHFYGAAWLAVGNRELRIDTTDVFFVVE
ncbi:MAG: hypothetical protein AAF481_06775 [Acidobacteriota bacterium]